jgi:hypothetical protein
MNTTEILLAYGIGVFLTFTVLVFKIQPPRDYAKLGSVSVFWQVTWAVFLILAILDGARAAWRWAFVRKRSHGL